MEVNLKKNTIIRAVILLVFAAMVIAVGGNKYTEVFSKKDCKIIIDAGHGAPDGGAVGIGGTEEKDINLAIAKKLQEVLESRGVCVIMTREGDKGLWREEDDTIRKKKVSDMKRRKEIMEDSGADLFISIHLNSFGDREVKGLHLFYDKSHPEGEEIAKELQKSIGKVTGAECHPVKTASQRLFLMKNPPMPAILVECGFLSNAEEEKKLKSEEYQGRIAWAIAEALDNYTK